MSKVSSKKADHPNGSGRTGHVNLNLPPRPAVNTVDQSVKHWGSVCQSPSVANDLIGVPSEVIWGVLGHSGASPSRPVGDFIDSKSVGDRICETIGDAALKAVVLEAIV